MKTEDLIKVLAADTQIQGPVTGALVGRLAIALGLAVVLIWATLGFRDDLLLSFVTPVSAMRFALTAALGLVGVRLALLVARPEGPALARLWPIAAVVSIAVGILIWAYLATPAEGRWMALVGKTIVTCLVTIPLLSILPVTAILVSLRRGATTAPALAGCVAGLAGSGFAAAVYAMHCTEDSPLFYVTWYGLAIISVTLISTLIGAKFLRW